MSTVVSWNGQSYTVPSTGELNWGGTLKVDGLLISLAQNSLQKSGGLFTLSADVDFGGTAGLKSLYFLTRTASPASTGVVRFANNEGFAWRNAANSSNLVLKVNATDQLEYNGSVLGGTIPATQGGTGQTTYAKGDTLYASAVNTLSKRTIGATQALSYVNVDVPAWLAPGSNGTILTIAAGALTYATLVDANVSTTADITLSKVNGGTANRIIASSGTSNRLAVCNAITAAHVLYADANGLPVGEANLAITRGGTGAGSKTAAFDALSPMDAIGQLIYGGASGTGTKLAAGTSGQYLKSTGAGAPAWTTFTQPTVQRFTSTGTTAGWLFTISTSSTVAAGDTYTNNGNTYTVLYALTAQSGQVLFCSGASAPTASGTLTRSAGAGTASITFTSRQALAAYTLPAGCVRLNVRLIAAGGAGGGAPTTTAGQISVGSGAAAGEYVEDLITSPASTIYYSVGAGPSGSAGANGSDGGSTTFGSQVAVGGSGGSIGSAVAGTRAVTGATGGTSSQTATFRVRGANGQNGWAAASIPLVMGGAGAPGPFGGGGTGAITTTGSSAGSAATAAGYGGGGGGGANGTTGNASVAGGAGADGIIIVEEYYQ